MAVTERLFGGVPFDLCTSCTIVDRGEVDIPSIDYTRDSVKKIFTSNIQSCFPQAEVKTLHERSVFSIRWIQFLLNFLLNLLNIKKQKPKENQGHLVNIGQVFEKIENLTRAAKNFPSEQLKSLLQTDQEGAQLYFSAEEVGIAISKLVKGLKDEGGGPLLSETNQEGAQLYSSAQEVCIAISKLVKGFKDEGDDFFAITSSFLAITEVAQEIVPQVLQILRLEESQASISYPEEALPSDMEKNTGDFSSIEALKVGCQVKIAQEILNLCSQERVRLYVS
jgi:hypothetical protein